MQRVENILKTESVFEFLLSILLFSMLPYTWWWFLALILVPDIGMTGYLVNNKVGAFTYNLFHHKGLAILFYISGWYFGSDMIMLAGIIIYGHASLDRALGYGLKYPEGFKYTHLGNLN